MPFPWLDVVREEQPEFCGVPFSPWFIFFANQPFLLETGNSQSSEARIFLQGGTCNRNSFAASTSVVIGLVCTGVVWETQLYPVGQVE